MRPVLALQAALCCTATAAQPPQPAPELSPIRLQRVQARRTLP